MVCNYLSRKSDNLSRLAFFGSVANLAHKNRAGQENCQNSFKSILKLYAFASFFSHADHSDQVKRTFTISGLQKLIYLAAAEFKTH